MITVGAFVSGDNERTFQGTVRMGRLNRIGPPDPKNTLTPVRQDLVSVDLAFGFSLETGRLQLGVGYDHRQDIDTVNNDSGARAYLEWQSGAWL